jgi:hypothetical protein
MSVSDDAPHSYHRTQYKHKHSTWTSKIIIDQSTLRLVDYYTTILHDSSSGLKMNIDRDRISRILKSRYILSIVPG